MLKKPLRDQIIFGMASYDCITQTTPYACSHLSRKDVVISRKLSLA
jgi:hypothetical protein